MRESLGFMMCPVTFTLPCTTNASSGRSVFIPTRPAWKTESGELPRCQHSSTSFSNCPGFEAYKTESSIRVPALQPESTKNKFIGHGITYSDDNLLRRMRYNRIIAIIVTVSMKSNDEIKITLIRVRLAFFTHIVRSSFTEVQPSYCHLC